MDVLIWITPLLHFLALLPDGLRSVPVLPSETLFFDGNDYIDSSSSKKLFLCANFDRFGDLKATGTVCWIN